jgi:hypothetical protein
LLGLAGALAMLPPAACPGAAANANEADYGYRAQPRDTLIGLGQRLLKDPRRWPALQQRNAIADPTRIPRGFVIRIPRAWMRQHPESATVSTVVGEATNAGAAIKAGDALSEGARIRTALDGYLTIGLADGSVITLNPETTLELERLQRYEGTGLRDTQLKLDAGSLETHAAPQGESGRFRIRTPVAISAVRGTQFRRAIDAAGALDRTEVVGGAVAVAAATAAVLVPAGYGTISDASAGPGAPVKLLAPPELSGLPSTAEDEAVQFNFPPVAGAQGYRAAVARDSDFHAIVAERVVDAANVAFFQLADGHYWLRLRSRDREGLEGPDAVHEFERHRLAAAPQPSEPRADAIVTGAGVVFRWSRVEDAVSYDFQLGRDAKFAETLIERTRVAAEDAAVLLDSVEPGTYYWRVASVDAQGNRGRWAAPQQYRQKRAPGPIGAPVLRRKSIEFTWQGEPGQRFRIQVARDPAFSRVIDDAQVEAPRVSLPRHAAGTYYARVQATDADGYVGPFTPTRRFVTPLPWWALLTPLLLVIPFL